MVDFAKHLKGVDTEQWVDGPTEMKDIAAAMRAEGNASGLIKEQTDEHNIQTLIDFAKARGLEESWVWSTLESIGAVCGKETDGSVWVLSLEWGHLHQVHDQLKALPVKVHSNFFPDQDKKPYEKLSAAERTSMKEKVYTEKHKLVAKYKNMGLDEPLIHGHWGGVADPFDGRVDWVRLEKFEQKLKEAVLKQANARLAEGLGVKLDEMQPGLREDVEAALSADTNPPYCSDKRRMDHALQIGLDAGLRAHMALGYGEVLITQSEDVPESDPTPGITGDATINQESGDSVGPGEVVTVVVEDQPQTQEVCDDAPLIEATQSGEGQPPAPVLPALTVEGWSQVDMETGKTEAISPYEAATDEERQAADDFAKQAFGKTVAEFREEAKLDPLTPDEKELFLPEHEAELTIIYQDGQLSGISEKLLKIWWNDIRRTSTNLKVIHDFQLLKNKIHAFRFAQNRVGATTLNEDGFLDIPGLLRSFGWLDMPKLTDEDCPNAAFKCKNPAHLHFKIDEIGNRIARLKDEADAFRENADIEAKKLEASAEGYLNAFGHLVAGYGEQNLKRTKSGKAPGTITGGKTVTMPRFQISFEKTGGDYFTKDLTGATLAPLFVNPPEEWTEEEKKAYLDRQQALKEVGVELKVKTTYDFDTKALWKAIDRKLISIDELDGVNSYPVNECGKYVIAGMKQPKPKKEGD